MPSGFTTTVPWLGSVVLLHTLPPSGLGMSLLARLPETGLSLGVVVLSGVATGTSFTGRTVSVTVAVLLSPLASVMV